MRSGGERACRGSPRGRVEISIPREEEEEEEKRREGRRGLRRRIRSGGYAGRRDGARPHRGTNVAEWGPLIGSGRAATGLWTTIDDDGGMDVIGDGDEQTLQAILGEFSCLAFLPSFLRLLRLSRSALSVFFFFLGLARLSFSSVSPNGTL